MYKNFVKLGLSTDEMELFKEFSKLLSKYPSLSQKFGLLKVHTHFDIKNNEVLHETNDPLSREYQVKVLKFNDLPKNSFPTQWAFSKSGKPFVFQYCCQ